MGAINRLGSMVSLGQWLYRDAHYLVADMEVDAEAAQRWVPRPLRVARPAMASLFTAYFPWNIFGSVYREAGLLIHVEHRGRAFVHSPWMIVDDDVALILGRELLGYPKKMGEISFRLDGDSIEGVAWRRGTELVSMRGTLGALVTDPPPMLGRPHQNLRCLLGFAKPRLVAFTPREQAIEVRRAELTVTIGGSERDPLDKLGFGRVHAAYLHRVNLGARGLPLPGPSVSRLFLLRQARLRVH